MEDEPDNANSGGMAPLPKHIPFPEVPHNSEVINELVMFFFVMLSAGMQFLHIYRTVWWLPESYIHHTINLYLIDPFLVLFIAVMISRRFFYVVIDKGLEFIYKDKVLKQRKQTAKYIFANIFFISLGSCTWKIFSKQNYLSLFLLLYPLVIYLLIFGLRIDPFLRSTNEIDAPYLNGIPMHCCSTIPVAIREEIEMLRNDFNNRFKQVIFTSVINAYYAGFVPCFFAQSFLYYDVIWVTQHTAFVWLGGFTLATTYCFPAKYCDVLHRAALHLGHWTKHDTKSNQLISSWSKSVAWTSKSVVKYSGDVYRAEGIVTTAIPGNLSHHRFYKIFCNPSVLYMCLTGLQTVLVILQLLLLCFAIEWHNVLSLSFLILTNHHTLFKIIRDYLVTQKVYTAELSIYEKLKLSTN